jgi:hypothetical protein
MEKTALAGRLELDLWGEHDFLVQDYDQPWGGRKYRIWGYFGFEKKPRSLRERDVVKHGPYRTLSVPTSCSYVLTPSQSGVSYLVD